MSSERLHLRIYTDGGCDPNPGPGGWAYLLIHPDSHTGREGSGGDPATTNNRMELTAVIEALKALTEPCAVDLYTDSQYVRRGITEWIEGWVKRNWRKSDGEPVLNAELWQVLCALTQEHQVTWHWVRGHAGDPYNERVDRLARAAIPRAAQPANPDATRVYLRIAGPPKASRGAFGWAASVVRGGAVEHLHGGHPDTTANHFSLYAALEALKRIPPTERVQFYTNNSYLHDGVTQWVPGWRKSGWVKKDGKPVQFRAEWEALDRLSQERSIEWVRLRDGDAPDVFGALKAWAEQAREEWRGAK